MGVGLYLTGSYPTEVGPSSGQEWLEQIAAWLEGHEREPLMVCRLGVNPDAAATLYVRIHPCAQEVEVTVPEHGLLSVEAKTSSAGPGYHIFVCELLHDLADQFKVRWDTVDEAEGIGDESGYFLTRAVSDVQEEMTLWLKTVAKIVREHTTGHQATQMVSMPLGHAYPDFDGVITPLGPRSLVWFGGVDDGKIHPREFFPWWDEGVGAGFFLGRAVTRMWQEIRWRPPISDREGELLMDVHLDLERAFHLDPKCAIPWREWYEIVQFLDAYYGYAEFALGEDLEEQIRQRAFAADDHALRIGFRRGRVQITLTGGWSLLIPGEMAEEWEDEGQTWTAWYAGRTIRFTSWSVVSEEDDLKSAREILAQLELPESDDPPLHRNEGSLVGVAVSLPHEEDGQSLWCLQTFTAIRGGFAQCMFFIQSRRDLPWAIEVWKSLKH